MRVLGHPHSSSTAPGAVDRARTREAAFEAGWAHIGVDRARGRRASRPAARRESAQHR